MNLIVQAIKSLFRKLENGIISLRTYTTKSIDSVNRSVEKAQNTADNALNAANTAQTTANNAQPDVILSVNIGEDRAYVNDRIQLVHGRIYVIIPTSSSMSNSANPQVIVNNIPYYLKPGISHKDTMYSNEALSANVIFKKDVPLIVMYDNIKKVFYVLTVFSKVYIESSSIRNHNESVPEYYYGVNGTNKASRYKYMRVKSSTEGSTKLFDIQVDDNGTVTAVEVT